MKKSNTLLKYLLTTLLTVLAILGFIVMFFQDKFDEKVVFTVRQLSIITSCAIIVISLLARTVNFNHREKVEREKSKDNFKYAPVHYMEVPSGEGGRIRLFLKYNSVFHTGMLVTIYKIDVANEMNIVTPLAMGVVEMAIPEEPLKVYFHCNAPHCEETDRRLLREGNVNLVKKLYIQPVAYKENLGI